MGQHEVLVQFAQGQVVRGYRVGPQRHLRQDIGGSLADERHGVFVLLGFLHCEAVRGQSVHNRRGIAGSCRISAQQSFRQNTVAQHSIRKQCNTILP